MQLLMKKNAIDGLLGFFKQLTATGVDTQITLPADIYYRTELICSYIAREAGFEEFNINTFLMLLYKEFIALAITNCNLKTIYKAISKDYTPNDQFTLIIDGETHLINKNELDYIYLNVEIAKRDYNELSLITREIKSVFGADISVEKLLANLLITTIEDYKRGVNKKLYINLKKRLKSMF